MPQKLSCEYYMQLAIDVAKESGEDIPVGAIVVKDGKILAKCSNAREKLNCVSAHAEILALEDAAKSLNNWRLDECEMYVTLEPCPMCSWAILNSRISKVYFGAYDANYGAFGSKINLCELQNPNAKSGIKIYGGIMENKCSLLLKDYFKKLRLQI